MEPATERSERNCVRVSLDSIRVSRFLVLLLKQKITSQPRKKLLSYEVILYIIFAVSCNNAFCFVAFDAPIAALVTDALDD